VFDRRFKLIVDKFPEIFKYYRYDLLVKFRSPVQAVRKMQCRKRIFLNSNLAKVRNMPLELI